MASKKAVVDALIEVVGSKVGTKDDYLVFLRAEGLNIGRTIALVISMMSLLGMETCDDQTLLRRSVRTQLENTVFALMTITTLTRLAGICWVFFNVELEHEDELQIGRMINGIDAGRQVVPSDAARGSSSSAGPHAALVEAVEAQRQRRQAHLQEPSAASTIGKRSL